MSNYLKNLLNESEKRRILSLHENRKKNEWSGLVMEQNPPGSGQPVIVPNDPDLSPETNKFNLDATKAEEWFNNRKSKMKNFPEGSVVSYSSKDGRTEFVWTTKDGTKLYMDGTAENAQGVKSTNKWYGKLSPDEVAKMSTLNPTQIQTNTNPDALVSTPSVSGSGPQGIMTGRELRKAGRQDDRTKNKAQREANKLVKQKEKTDKIAIKECNTYYNTYVKNEKRIVQLNQQASYVNYLNTCCEIFKSQNTNLTGKPFCKTQLGSGPTNPTVNNNLGSTTQVDDNEINPNK